MRLAMAMVSLLFTSAVLAAEVSFEEGALKQELNALQSGSLADFTAQGLGPFKSMPEAEFKKASGKFAPMLKAGYTSTYLGAFNEENGMRVHYCGSSSRQNHTTGWRRWL